MEKHEPIYYKKLTPAERGDMASITKHPGMDVVLEKIMKGHAHQQLLQIMDVPPDDPDRVPKLAAISSTAYAMQLFYELVKQELELNFRALQQEEERLKREAERNDR